MPDEKKEAEKYPMPTPIIVPRPMYKTPQIAPDGHENLSKEDIDARH